MNHSTRHATETGRLLISSTGDGFSQSGISIEDWDLLFCAVTARLRQCANNLLYAGSLPQQTPSAISFSSEVLECVEAMAQLHAELRQPHPSVNE